MSLLQQVWEHSCVTHSLQRTCFDSSLKHNKKWVSLWICTIQGTEIHLITYSLYIIKQGFDLLYSVSPYEGQHIPSFLCVLLLLLYFRLNRNIHKNSCAPCVHLTFPISYHGAGWRASSKRTNSAFPPPPSWQPSPQPSSTFLKCVALCRILPPCPQWSTAPRSQDSKAHSGHLFPGNFSAPYQYWTALASRRRLIKMTNLMLIDHHLGENNTQPWHCW